MNLSPLPIQKFFDNNGRPLKGGLLFTYEAGTTNKIATASDEAGTLNTNPVVLDFRGEANVWLDQTLTYKFVLSPEGDTDPPTRPIWTVDNISAAVTFASLTAQIIGRILWPQTIEEAAAGVTPSDYAYPPGNGLRYGMVGDGITDNTSALSDLKDVAAEGVACYIPSGTYAYATSPNWAIARLDLRGDRETILLHTGTGVAFNMDAGASTFLYGAVLQQLVIKGSTNTTDGLYMGGIVYSTFRNIEVRSVNAKAFHIKGGVANLYDTLQVNRSLGGVNFSPVPDYGFYLDTNGGGNFTADCTFINCDAENFDGGTSGVGCHIEDGSGNTFRGGSFETLLIGLEVSVNSRHNHFDSIWFEHNATKDVVDLGVSNQYTNCHLVSSSSGTNFDQQADGDTIVGGYIRQITLASGSVDTTFIGVAFDNSVGNGIVGPGTYTAVGCSLVSGVFVVTAAVPDVIGQRGTWTPSVGGTATYTRQEGYYTIVNRTVTIWGRLTINAIGTGSATSVFGLPFQSNATYYGSGLVSFFASVATAVTALHFSISPSTSQLDFRTLVAAATGTGTANILQNGADIIFSGTYLLP